MDLLTPEEILETVESLILTMTEDENRFYVALDLAYQLKDELLQVITSDE